MKIKAILLYFCINTAFAVEETSVPSIIWSQIKVTVGIASFMYVGPSIIRIIRGQYPRSVTFNLPFTVKTQIAKNIIQTAEPLIFPSEQEQLKSLKAKEAADKKKAKEIFVKCMSKNSFHQAKDAESIPTVCQEAACMFKFISGSKKFDQTIRLLNRESKI